MSCSRAAIFALTLLVPLACLPRVLFAAVQVKLSEPQWVFLLDNRIDESTTARLQSSESRFAQTLQPLLAAQDYAAATSAFTKRDIEHDSAALRQLRGQVLLAAKHYSKAEKALLAALELKPNLALAHRSLSMVYMLQNNHGRAQVHLRKAIELGVADAQLYGQLGFVNLQMGLAASAISAYQNALMLEMENVQWQQGMLYALIQSHAFDQAQALLDEMLKSDFENPDLWLQRGQIALRQGRHSQAITSVETALELGAQVNDNLVLVVQLHLQSGSPRRAVELLVNHSSSFLNSVNKRALVAFDQAASWLVAERNWPLLKQLLGAVDPLIVRLPQQGQARMYGLQAELAIAENKRKQAGRLLEKALAINPSDGGVLLQLAALAQHRGRTERAILYYQRAEALSDYRESALLGRAQLEIDRQAYAQALKLLRQVARDNPARSDLHANIRTLGHLARQHQL